MNKTLFPLQVIFLASVASFGQIFFTLPEDADTYFVMNLGRYILENGFPTVDPFTIHENLKLVAQQWLSGIFFWEVYKNFGVDGLRLVDAICGAMLVLIYWQLCLYVSGGNKTLSFALSLFVGLLVTPSIVPRPQIFSALLLLCEVFLLEKFTRTKDFKFLLPLPLVSIALVNFHSAIWLMSLVICLPFLFVKDFRHIKFLFAAMAGIFISGLINPYGLDAMTYVFRSYGVDLINSHVPEMFTPTAHDLRGKCFYLLEALLIFSLAKFKVPWRYIFLSGGITFMSIMHGRNLILFYFLATFPIAYAWRILKLKMFADWQALPTLTFFLLLFVNTACITTLLKDELEKLSAPLEILLAVSTLVVLYNLLIAKSEGRLLHPAILPKKNLALFITALIIAGITFTTFEGNHRDSDGRFTTAMKFILRSERPENISLYIDQGLGGLAGMFGMRYYIDSRSEVFLPANNGQKNIFGEYINFALGNIYYKDFFARYDFTHIIVTTDEPFIYEQISRDKDFRVIYESERVDGYTVKRLKVFVPR